MASAIVTGSAGFLGCNLVAALEHNGVEVFAYDSKTGTDLFLAKDVPKVDTIYHLACTTQVVAERIPLLSRLNNLESTKVMAEIAHQMGAHFVFTSTASVYGDATRIPTPIWELPHPLSVYARHKYEAERFLRAKSANSDFSCSIFRLSNVYGPYQTLENPYCGVIGRFIHSAVRSQPLEIIGDGNQTRDFTFVDDVIRALIHTRPGLVNLASGQERRINELAYLISEIVGNPYIVSFVEPRSVDKIPRRCLVSDIECPTRLSAGLMKTIDWYLGIWAYENH